MQHVGEHNDGRALLACEVFGEIGVLVFGGVEVAASVILQPFENLLGLPNIVPGRVIWFATNNNPFRRRPCM